MVGQLARNAGLPMPKIYVIETAQPNAFATGRNPQNSVVAVSRGLLQALEPREVAAVVAHELAHIRSRDTLTMTVTATIAGAISMLAQFGLFFGGGNNRDNPLGGIGALLMVFLAPVAAALVQMAVSRTREYEADRDGAEISGDPLALASALAKIAHYAKTRRQRPRRAQPGDGAPLHRQPALGAAHGQPVLDAPRAGEPHRRPAEDRGRDAGRPHRPPRRAAARRSRQSRVGRRLARARRRTGRRKHHHPRPLGLALGKTQRARRARTPHSRRRAPQGGARRQPFQPPSPPAEIADSRDRALANRLVTTALRRHGHIDLILAELLERGMPKKSGSFESVLRIALAQLVWLPDIGAHSAPFLAVEAREARHQGPASRRPDERRPPPRPGQLRALLAARRPNC